MNNNDNLLVELDEEFEYGVPYGEEFSHAISPRVKQFLFEFYGDPFLDIEPKTYKKIGVLIKKRLFSLGEDIPDILYRNRTIRNMDEFDRAFASFIPTNEPINWPTVQCWFNREFPDNDDNEDTYLEDSDPIDLNEQEIRAKEIIKVADELIENIRNFAFFTKSGYEILNQEIHQFLENNASFDLAILSNEGFEALQKHIYLYISSMLEDLSPLMPER